METTREWPRVKWDADALQRLSEALLVMNPNGFSDADSQASYIRSLSERELYRCGHIIDISTGGWTVCFYNAWDYVAIATMTPYTAWQFATQSTPVEA